MSTDTPPATTTGATEAGTGTGTGTETDGIIHTTVGGIRTVLARRSTPGPVTAGLLFRVGRADETLATSGITHLVEHLALHRHGLGDLHYNGATAAVYTHFHVTGTPADVVEYLNGVCAALRDLPLDRLETEKEILRTEAAGRGHGPAHGMPLWRYGSRGYGLTSYPEAGLHRLTAANVRDWAANRFTTENAVLWITADTVPDGLDLTLPTGTWHPTPTPTSALPTTPASFVGEDGVVVLTAVIPRSTAGTLFTDLLGKELFRALRQKGGYSYTAAAEYEPRDSDFATVTAYADALPRRQDAMVGAFVDVLAALRAGTIEQADLDAVRATALARFDTSEPALARLPGEAMNLLLRHPSQTDAEARAAIEAVTVADLRRVARDVWADALMQVPGRNLDWAGLAAAPTGSADIVTGRRYTAVADRATALLVAADGVSLTGPDAQITIRYAECSLMYVFPDGARHLIGHDGLTLAVEPTLHGITAAELAPLDAGVPPAAVVTMPPRDPSRIPQPTAAAAAPTAPAKRSAALTAWIWFLGTLTVLVGGFTALAVLAEFDPELSPQGPDWAALAIMGTLTGCAASMWAWKLRKRRRGEG
ncbi:insulinase family protein [Streptomyces sp. RerS4]|uniref:M16 family metallopeptidase n=1 Tax=Streptomyces sp. RerS4 TaxID=2942449 RepID=UPI00201C9D10|nr:insulinase family protein [Streptomyces sp. RerS4]UQX02587.1 insulinase family protein [Streptomyces sp. RerS4]